MYNLFSLDTDPVPGSARNPYSEVVEYLVAARVDRHSFYMLNVRRYVFTATPGIDAKPAICDRKRIFDLAETLVN